MGRGWSDSVQSSFQRTLESRAACVALAETDPSLRWGDAGPNHTADNPLVATFNALAHPGRAHGEERTHADDQPAGPQGPRSAEGQEQGPCDGTEPAEARCLHPRLYDDPEEAELGSA